MKNVTPLNRIQLIISVAFLLLPQIIYSQTESAATLEVTLTPSNYNNYNLTCFGSQDGSISATVGNGTAPYTYEWSVDQTTYMATGLAAGYYRVTVHDINGAWGEAEITLIEPSDIRVEIYVPEFSNGYNVSCHFCLDGSVNLNPYSGVPPFSCYWSDGATTSSNRNNMHAGNYIVTVTDDNGCTLSQDISISAPDRDDWTMTGNAGTDPATQFIGTSDNKELIFKTNATERIKIGSSGTIKFNSLSGGGDQDLAVNNNGELVFKPQPDWSTIGNILNVNVNPFIGTINNTDLIFKTYSSSTNSVAEKMRITAGGQIGIETNTIPTGIKLGISGNTYINGLVGIGTQPQSGYGLVVDTKIGAREINVIASGAWPDYVFGKNYKNPKLESVGDYILKYQHLPDMPPASEIETNGQNIGELQRLQQQKLEEIYLYLIDIKTKYELQEKEIERIKKENKNLRIEIKKIKK